MSQKKWNSNLIPDQTGRVTLITGGAKGIGAEVVKVLCSKNAEVIIGSRDVEEAKEFSRKMMGLYPKCIVSVFHLDLASLKSIARASEYIINKHSSINVLINNAGVMFCPYEDTDDGFELQMATNYLGHFAFTGKLLPLLKASEESRIVMISSVLQKLGSINLEDINWKTRRYNSSKAYADSKLACLLFNYEFARKCKGKLKVPKVVAAHPGWTKSDLQRHSKLMQFGNIFFAQKASQGALSILRAGYDLNAASGDYYGPSNFFGLHGLPIKLKGIYKMKMMEKARELWVISEKLTRQEFKL